MTRLFRVTSKAYDLPHKGRIYDAVEIFWFVVYRVNSAISHEQLIKNYVQDLNNLDYVSENNLYELFTEEEAGALKEYLLKVHEKGYKIKEVDLSLEVYTLGYGDMILEEKEGYYKLNEEDRYNLPFVVWGYYNVSSAKDVGQPR